MQNISFIGLGHMGAPMARNLLKAGLTLTVCDLLPSALEAFSDTPATRTANAQEAVQNADVVITTLPTSQHVEALYLGEHAILDALRPDTLLIDCSTISPASAIKVAQTVQQHKGLVMLDAPISGGTSGALAATLTFMVGGDATTVERATPVLLHMGKNIFHAGPNGAGQMAKVCNNMLLGILMIGTSEALNLGIANGLDPAVLSEIMRASSGGNWVLERYNPCPGVMPNAPASHQYQGGFASELILKDLGLAEYAALGSRTAIPLGAIARQIYALHSARGNGKLDFSSIMQALAPKSGG